MKKIISTLLMGLIATIMLSACSDTEKITVLGENWTEAKIFAYMHKELIEDATDIEVDVKVDLPSPSVNITAMDEGEGDLTALYTGELTSGYFPYDASSNDPDHYVNEAQKGFDEHYNFKWYDPLGFENQYVFAVRREYAEEHNLETLSDIEKIADEVVVRVDSPWLEREDDGYRAFQEKYGYEFGDVRPMEVTLVYKAIQEGQTDVGLVYSTDARITLYDLVVLEDDKQFFPPYLMSSVIKKETLEKYPEIGEVLDRMIGKFDEETVRELNGQVDMDGRDPHEVVKEFLEENNMLK